jgi:hypothetical protein
VTVKGDTVILAEVTYTYTSPFTFNLGTFKSVGTLSFSEKFYARPRNNKIACADCP